MNIIAQESAPEQGDGGLESEFLSLVGGIIDFFPAIAKAFRGAYVVHTSIYQHSQRGVTNK